MFNHGHNILELFNVLTQTRLTTSKTKRDGQYSKLDVRVASRVAKRLKTQEKRKYQENLKLGGDIAQCPVSLPETKFQQQQSKNTRKQISNFSCPVLQDFSVLFQISCPGLLAENVIGKLTKIHLHIPIKILQFL